MEVQRDKSQRSEALHRDVMFIAVFTVTSDTAFLGLTIFCLLLLTCYGATIALKFNMTKLRSPSHGVKSFRRLYPRFYVA